MSRSPSFPPETGFRNCSPKRPEEQWLNCSAPTERYTKCIKAQSKKKITAFLTLRSWDSSAQGVRAFISRRKASSARAQLSTKQIHSFSKLWRNAANPRPCWFFPPYVLKAIDKVKYQRIFRDFSFGRKKWK